MRFHRLMIAAVIVMTASMVMADDSDESHAVWKIELLGGKVKRDETLPGRPVIAIDFRGSKKFNNKYMHVLAEFTSLKSLNVNDLAITDDGLKKINKLKSLEQLYLIRTKITDDGMREIAELTNLNLLDLNFTRITDAGLKHVSQLKNLKSLHLCGSSITDKGLKELAGLENLTYLELVETKVSDDGLKTLSELKNLKTVFLNRTNTTHQGVDELKQALPNLQISR